MEGFEVPILKTILFDKLDISVVTVEYAHGKKEEYTDLMESKGYTLYKTIEEKTPSISLYVKDYVFVKNGFVVWIVDLLL